MRDYELSGASGEEEKVPLLDQKEDPVSETHVEATEEDENEKKAKDDTGGRIRTLDVGVWRIFYVDARWSFLPGFETVRKFRETMEGLPHVWRFLLEIWNIAPGYFLLWMFLSAWGSIQGAISLWITAQMMQTMQKIILTGVSDMRAVRYALALKFLNGLSELLHRRLLDRSDKQLKKRVGKHCGFQLLEVYSRLDLVTLQRKDVQSKLSKMSNQFLGDGIWRSFRELVSQITGLLEMASQGWFLADFFRTQENGWKLAVVCVMPTVVQGLIYTNKFGDVWFAHAINKAYLRLRSVGDTIQNKEFFEEIISSGLSTYFQEEYHKAMEEAGDVSFSHIWRVIWDRQSLWKDTLNIWLSDASLIYYLVAVAIDPSSFSLTSLTVLRESANSFAWTIWRLFERDNSLNEKMRFIHDFYSLLELKGEIDDGIIPYPPSETMEFEGMKVEFKNVSMKYPKTSSYALKNVSFTIPAGSTVILVGANGSGKTTTVSLLSRLLDVTSGEILVDDRPIKSYQVSTLRNAQSILRQSYQHFPFSVKENIGMGDPRWLHREEISPEMIEERIMRAAKRGGADEVLEEIKGKDKKRVEFYKTLKKEEEKKLVKDGSATPSDADEKPESAWDTNVQPVNTWEGSWLLRGSKLSDMSEEVEKKIELSGGQWQRLALARLFMRAERDQVRLVCTDEPSAALDPRAEYEVFQQLRTLKGRKTTKIFITHRFGHLTKHADLILCLKKGELVEAGTHEELIKTNGEYATLYQIQAQAFQTT